MSYSDIVMQVKELVGRQLSINEISKRLHMNVDEIKSIILKLKH